MVPAHATSEQAVNSEWWLVMVGDAARARRSSLTTNHSPITTHLTITMLIRLTKISDATHRLTVLRDDGGTESVELASRSFLLHDFLHYAVESAAGLRGSFWGQLAAGKTMAELGAAMERPPEGYAPELLLSEPAATEAIVGCFTGLAHDRATPAEAVDAARRLFEAQRRPLPGWLGEEFAAGVKEQLRQLKGEWKAVAYGGAMELRF